MRLVISEESIIENEYKDQMNKIEETIRLKETELYEAEQELNVLENKYRVLKESVFIDAVLCVVVLFIFIGFGKNAMIFAYRLIASSYFTIIILGGVVGFISYVVKKAMKEIPLYIRCKKEENGTSSDTDNYVYKIESIKKNISRLKEEIIQLKDEYSQFYNEAK